jgi:Kef-type K+ transport system membrane component KefB
MDDSLFFSFVVIFSGAAALATLSLATRQPIIIAYIMLGVIVGPSGLNWVHNAEWLQEISHIGIAFLLFLLGLDMQPQSLLHILRKATLVALISSVIFFIAGYGVGKLFNFTELESVIIGLSSMFSSTIIGIKLLPTTVLHHRYTGELMVGLLLLQDLIAIIILIIMGAAEDPGNLGQRIVISGVTLPILIGIAFAIVHYIILPLIKKYDRFQEYIFLLAIGWCMGLAELGYMMGLSKEMGAFIAGVTLATSPISLFIAASLKPIRDFFLILFFFTLGAGFDLSVLPEIWFAAVVLAFLMLTLKPVTFRFLLNHLSESDRLAWDIGLRLGQTSEFSLLMAFLALEHALISPAASYTIQATAIISFVASTYLVIFNCPSPIAISERLRRD